MADLMYHLMPGLMLGRSLLYGLAVMLPGLAIVGAWKGLWWCIRRWLGA